jgi:hypothetical protein
MITECHAMSCLTDKGIMKFATQASTDRAERRKLGVGIFIHVCKKDYNKA